MSDGKDLFQGLFEATVNHYTREAIIAALDYVASLSEEDVKEMTAGMSPEAAARVYRVWRACASAVPDASAQVRLPGMP